MAEKTLSIITPVWNQAPLTQSLIGQNFRQYHDRVDLEWIIVNNGSSDDTARILQAHQSYFYQLDVWENETNQGFPIACNQGVKVARGEYLLFLNNDVRVFGDYITPLLDTLQAHEDKALVGPELHSHDTGWNVFGDALPIRYIPGWCLGISKATFDTLGGFDERYSPADYEDMDLCYNATQQGYSLIQIPLPIAHLSGQSQLPGRRIITEQNRVKFAYKWGLQ